MYANAEQALEGLRDNRFKARVIKDEKIVANNTRLLYFADDLVGLKLHETVIALYRPDGVSIDLRGPQSPNGEGWFTSVTLDRIDRFTPARTLRSAGLTMVVTNPDYGAGNWTANARLYAHGCSISSNGSFTNGIPPLTEAAILRAHHNFNRKATNFAKRCVGYWRRGGQISECCQGDGDTDAHLIMHIEANEPCIPWHLENHVAKAKGMGLLGDAMEAELIKAVTEDFRALRTEVIHTIEPNFPYPQPHRTGGH